MSSASETLAALASGERAAKFLSVGVLGYFCDQAVLTAVVEATAVSPVWAKLVSAEAAIVVMFAANEQWTFAGEEAGWLPARFLRSNTVRAGGALVAWVVLTLLVTYADVQYLVANTVGIGVGVVVNYFFESLVTWRVQE